LSATVAAFFAEGFLIDVEKIAVEVEEETLKENLDLSVGRRLELG
jgi:hypothetical protein